MRAVARVLQLDEGTVRHIVRRDDPDQTTLQPGARARRLARLTGRKPHPNHQQAIQRRVDAFGPETVTAHLELAEQTPGSHNLGGWLRTACREQWAATGTHKRQRGAWE